MSARGGVWLGDGPAGELRLVIARNDPNLLRLSPVLAETLVESVRTNHNPTMIVRRQLPYLLLGPQDERLPFLADGLRWASERGLPVFRRISGGTAVLLDETCLSFGVVVPCREMGHIRRNYWELTQVVRNALAGLGVPAEFGQAAGGYCEGPYDLLTRGRKIAGIAQAVRRGVALVSGMILIGQDPEAVTNTLNAFYAHADPAKFGRLARYTATPLTNLERELHAVVPVCDVEAALIESARTLYPTTLSSIAAEELATAQTLLSLRRMAVDRFVS